MVVTFFDYKWMVSRDQTVNAKYYKTVLETSHYKERIGTCEETEVLHLTVKKELKGTSV